MGFKSLFPANTIVGKALRGDKQGAISSAKNYVSSGELLTDIKNVGTVVASGGTKGWTTMGKKAFGSQITEVLNPNTKNLPSQNLKPSEGISSFSATPQQLANLQIAEEKKNFALQQGAGVFASKPVDFWDKMPLSADKSMQYTGLTIENKTSMDTTTLIAIGIGAFLLLK